MNEGRPGGRSGRVVLPAVLQPRPSASAPRAYSLYRRAHDPLGASRARNRRREWPEARRGCGTDSQPAKATGAQDRHQLINGCQWARKIDPSCVIGPKAVFEAPGLVSAFDDLVVKGRAVEQRFREPGKPHKLVTAAIARRLVTIAKPAYKPIT